MTWTVLFSLDPCRSCLWLLLATGSLQETRDTEAEEEPAVIQNGDSEGDPSPKTVTPRPNILFYLIDTCRADSLSPYGYERETSPFLERLAEEGVTFESCISQAAWTKPSMGAILTSKYPSATGVYTIWERLHNDHVTFPEVLEDGGYYTSGFSANPIMGAMSNYRQGFRRFQEAATINGADPIERASGSSILLNEKVFPWLEGNQNYPMFLYVHSVDPHEEYRPAAAYLKAFADPLKEEEYREQRKKLLGVVQSPAGNADLNRTQVHFEQAGIEAGPFIDYSKRLYDANILCNDDQIEALFNKLDGLGLLENLLIIVTADHGEEFFEHGGTSHGFSLYHELLSVPLILWWPARLPGGVRIAEVVQSIDI